MTGTETIIGIDVSKRVCDNWVFTTIRTFPYSEGRDSVRSDSGITA